ncbi:UNVERIFIED_CONTAM: hypothetical protein GTU68_023342 [Idotea baltica]|nr:hypothetical protein [Idotea baltica]
MTICKHSIISKTLEFNPSHIIIGFSGGIDSSVLVNIFKETKIPIIAIYINHAIHPDANSWQQHCNNICDEHNIAFITHKLGKVPKGESFEAWASKQRIAFFEQQMAKCPAPILLLGHHQDDQAETFLLQAIRGSGLAGLAGIPYSKKLKHGFVLRPLLEYSKSDIENYAKVKQIKHIYDDSNEDSKYKRNLVRNEIIPILKQVNPTVNKTLARSASICANSNSVLNKLLAKELDIICNKDNEVEVKLLAKLDNDIQQSLLHLWFKKNTNLSLKHSQVISIIKTISGSVYTGWYININECLVASIEYNLLKIKYLEKNIIEFDKTTIQQWLGKNLHLNKSQLTNIVIRDRSPDDKCRYIGRNKPNKLKILFQELKIPANQRAKARVIELENKIIAVYPFFICDK